MEAAELLIEDLRSKLQEIETMEPEDQIRSLKTLVETLEHSLAPASQSRD